ncbi:hypothetical protein V8E51_014053 [Hyaloscypha variabilis]
MTRERGLGDTGCKGRTTAEFSLPKSAESIVELLSQEDQMRYFGISHREESEEDSGKYYTSGRRPHAIAHKYHYKQNNSNKYQEAEPIYQECYVKYQAWGMEEETPFEYAKLSHHKVFCRIYHKDFDGAIKLAERGGNGNATYFTLQSYYAVSTLYAHLKKWDEAKANMRTALTKVKERAEKGFRPDAAVARTDFHLSQIIKEKDMGSAEAEGLVTKARSVLSRLLPSDPLDGVPAEDVLALFGHLQPIFGGMFT